MYKKLTSVLFPIAVIMLIVAIYWGFQQQKQKNDVMIKAENQYQRAYGNLTYYIGQLDEQIGQTLSISSTSNNHYRKGLINVWRLTSEAQQQVGQLPTNYIPFNDAETFLTKVANFSYKAAVRDLETEPLTENELANLKELYKNAKDIKTRLADLQSHIARSGLRWIDVELALDNEDTAVHNPVVASLKDMNTTVEAYAEVDWGPAVNSLYTDDNIKLLSAAEHITQEQALKKAEAFLKMDMKGAEIIEQGTESTFPTITIKKDGYKLTYIKKGGLLVGFNDYREIGEAKLKREDAIDHAEEFLERHEFDELEEVSYIENDNTASIVFVSEQDDILIYPDKVIIRVALDNGDVIGLQASEYVAHHHKRELGKPTISKANAQEVLSKEFKLEETDLAIILNDIGEEVLCYQFTGKIDDKQLRVYINANSKREEKIERIN